LTRCTTLIKRNHGDEIEGINYAGMPGEGLTTQSSKHALQDHQMQIMLLEQQKQKRLYMIQQELGIMLAETYSLDFHAGALPNQMEQMKLSQGRTQSKGSPGQRNEMPPPSAPVAGRSASRKKASSTNPGTILVHRPAPPRVSPPTRQRTGDILTLGILMSRSIWTSAPSRLRMFWKISTLIPS
jgi:hypothetical protein